MTEVYKHQLILDRNDVSKVLSQRVQNRDGAMFVVPRTVMLQQTSDNTRVSIGVENRPDGRHMCWNQTLRDLWLINFV